MSGFPQLKDKLVQLAAFLDRHSAFINAHMVDFLTHDHWRRLLSPQVQGELLRFTSVTDENLSLDAINSLKEEHSFPHLEEFLIEAKAHTLQGLGVCSNIEKIDPSWNDDSVSSTFPSHLDEWLMTEKKHHEVGIMGSFIASLCRKYDTTLVVDYGSGKGYLSFCLAAKHHLNVLGVDAQATNTCGATVRKDKLLHAMNRSLVKNSEKCQTNVRTSEKIPGNDSCNPNTPCSNSSSECMQVCVKTQQDRISDGITCLSCHKDGHHVKFLEDCALVSEISNKQIVKKGVFVPVTSMVTKDTDLDSLVQEFETVSQNYDNRKCYSDITEYSVSERKNLLICGLHTCGPLATNMIRLFLTNSSAKVFCTVGCCYHLLQEQFINNSDAEDLDSLGWSTESDFPLSTVLKQRNYKLGRNARMLSSQPLERISKRKMRYPKSLFYRSLLQALLVSRLGYDKNVHLLVGRSGLKCQSFIEYIRKIEQKFPSLNLQVSDTFLSTFDMEYKDSENELYAFQQLRSILAPCIEALVLLDRLVYLLEQECIQEAHLLRLFDPVTSPRCYALLAIKNPLN